MNIRSNTDGSRIRWIVILFWKFLAFVGISILVLSRQSYPTDSPPCAGGGAKINLHRHLVRRQADPPVQQTVIIDSTSTSLPETTTNAALNNSISDAPVTGSDQTTPSGGLYPPEIFNMKQKRSGAVILYCLCLLYMFCALAIVCDEFFVPALEVITEKLDISEDVAGATMMAAGGSAPELFTSVIGVFFAESDVGIGTIVGSAVFNVLFVIGMCAIFSQEILQLTWWPLFRDCSFYIVSLLVLIWAFYDSSITWYESLSLLMCYLAYVSFMKFNQQVEAWVKSKISKTEPVSVKVYPLPEEQTVNTLDKPPPKPTQPTAEQSTDSGSSQKSQFHSSGWKTAAQKVSVLKKDCPKHKRRAQKTGLFHLILHSLDPTEHRDSRISGSNTATLNYALSRPRVKASSKSVNRSLDRTQTMDEITQNGVNKVRRSRSWQPMSKHATRMQSQNPDGRTFSIEGADQVKENGCNGPSTCTDYKESKESINMPPISEEASNIVGSSSNNSFVPVNTTEIKPGESQDSSEDEQPEFLDMSWPKGDPKKQAVYIFLIGITGPLWLLLPDVRRPGREKYVAITFFGSIFAIAIYSYIMVWMADVIGQVARIPIEIMGLTFLAAGTSVPDLITSVIVAKKGLGDMAVSSSIGSNIFDVTVGLPLPWILKSAISKAPVSVEANGMFCSIALLFMMLIFVFISIAAYKWKMTKGLGACMFLLYGAFVVISLLLQKSVIPCPFNRS